MKNLKPVPADKKKSLGKLPTDVRNKMGYAKKGKMVKDEKPKEKPKKPGQIFIELKTPMKARYGTMAKGDVKEGLKKSNEFKSKLMKFKTNAVKKLSGAAISEKESNQIMKMIPSIKDSPDTREAKMKAVKMKLSKLKTGGEMKGYGAARTSGMGLQDENLIPGKSMDYIKDLI
jgi:hypothetical protein